MSATLHIMQEGVPRKFECGRLFTIGRGRNNDIVVSDPKASRNHALIRCLGDGGYYLMDTGSSNGTLLNDKAVLIPSRLKDADEIKVGSHVFRFHLDAETPVTEPDADVDAADSTILTVGGSIHEIAILVADIRNYTAIAEKIPMGLLTQITAKWFRSATEIVEAHDGIVDKFIGDAIMVRWIADKTRPIADAVLAALRAAREMNMRLADLNVEFPRLPLPLAVGIGINSGQAVLGNVGLDKRRDYTALGDAVNLAFRLETLTKELGKNVVIGPDSYRHLPESAWKTNLVSAAVKGKQQPIEVCALTFEQIDSVLAALPRS